MREGKKEREEEGGGRQSRGEAGREEGRGGRKEGGKEGRKPRFCTD